MSTIKSKKCTKCGENKPLTEFRKDRTRKDGLQYVCKSCNRKYYEKNREAYKERDRKYYEKNREAEKEKKRKYYQENKRAIKARHKKYNKERYANDPEYRTSCLLRKQTRRLGDFKNTTTLELVGCSPKEFWLMNGTPSIEELQDLHIDHVVPMSWFNLSNEDHVKVCNHYLNLQYLSSADNLEKNDKYAGSPDNILGYKEGFDIDAYVSDRLKKIKALNLHI